MKNLNNLITRYENLEQVRKKCENLLHHIVILPLDAVHVLLNLDNCDLKSSIYQTDLMSHSSQDIPTGSVTSTNGSEKTHGLSATPVRLLNGHIHCCHHLKIHR